MIRVVNYDIVNDRRRNKMFKLLKDYGQWVQYSLFEVECDEQRWIELEHQLYSMLGEGDSLCIYPLCNTCQKKVQYKGEGFYKWLEKDNCIL